MRTLFALLLLTGFALAQPPANPFESASLVVAGSLENARGNDLTSRVDVTGTLRVARIIKGDIAPGTLLRVAWSYVPRGYERPAETNVPPRIFGLWMLEPQSDDVWKPLPFGAFSSLMGGVVLEVPSAEPASVLGATPQDRIAAELAAAIEDLAAKEGDRLNPQMPYKNPRSGVRIPVQGVRFMSLVSAMTMVPPNTLRPYCQHLAGSAYPSARGAGLTGLMRLGDADAVLAFERDVEALAPMVTLLRLPSATNRIAFRDRPDAAHALGRLATGEQDLALEFSAAAVLGGTAKPDFLPYFAVMLEGNTPEARNAGILGFCAAYARRRQSSREFCPDSSPVLNPNEERRLTEYWRAQWRAELQRLGEEGVTLPDVRVPNRYGTPPPGDIQTYRVPVEERFGMVVMMLARNQSHFPVQGLDERDRDTLLRIAGEVQAKLEEYQQQLQKHVQEARVQGKRLDPTAAQQARAGRQTALKDGLAEVRSALSSEGWQAFEKHLDGMNAVGSRIGPPPRQ